MTHETESVEILDDLRLSALIEALVQANKYQGCLREPPLRCCTLCASKYVGEDDGSHVG